MDWPTWTSKDADEQDEIRRKIMITFALGAVALFGSGLIAGFFWGVAQ